MTMRTKSGAHAIYCVSVHTSYASHQSIFYFRLLYSLMHDAIHTTFTGQKQQRKTIFIGLTTVESFQSYFVSLFRPACVPSLHACSQTNGIDEISCRVGEMESVCRYMPFLNLTVGLFWIHHRLIHDRGCGNGCDNNATRKNWTIPCNGDITSHHHLLHRNMLG